MKTKLRLAQALPLATKIKKALSPACERIKIAGSIRRRKPTVGDMRGEKNGQLQKQFLVTIDPEDGTEVMLELWLTTPGQWGYIFALRTGPAEFNQAWVTQRNKGGLLPNEYRFDGGWLWRSGKKIDTLEEKDVFDLIGGDISPADREQWRRYYPLGEELA